MQDFLKDKDITTIFLDFDGVLNKHEWCHIGGPRINQENAKVLQKMLEKPHQIVVHSTWGRHIEESGVEVFKWMLKTHGITANIVDGFSGSHDQKERFDQILNYIENNGLNKSMCIIIDDMPFVFDTSLKRITPHPSIGLEPRHYTEFINKTS